jgi:hypothetical protein
MFNPDDGPARIFRYAPRLPLPNVLSLFFKRSNLLIIDRELFDMLSDDQRRRVLRTEEKTLEVRFPPNKPPVIVSRNQ